MIRKVTRPTAISCRDIHWLDYVARLREELQDGLPGPYHSLEYILLKVALYRREMNFPIANL